MLDDLIKERLKKRENLSRAGYNPYPARIERTHTTAEAVASFLALARSKKKVAVVGRVIAIRGQGGVAFVDVSDATGKIQVVLKKDILKDFSVFRNNLDVGDFIQVSGLLFKTKAGEKSIDVKKVVIAAKAVRPIPSDFYGLKDPETRLRKRYLDMMANPEVREIFRKKAVFWQTTREELLAAGFLEVETPILENIPGGAEAEPFITRHNALGEDFYLRISPELALKRLMVGGFEKIFEIGRVFRNEGIDAEHLQDYTQIEMYWAYQDYKGLMRFVEALVKKVIKATCGTFTTIRDGKKIDWGKKWKTYDYYKLFQNGTGIDLASATREQLLAKARELKLQKVADSLGRGRLIDLLFKNTVRGGLRAPGFLIDPPVDIEPLAKRTEYDKNRVERFQIVAAGTELGKGFSELNDPIDQQERFTEQAKLRQAGDQEAQRTDQDYLEALQYGMPPTAGFGLSERLFAVLLDKPVRETVIFPLMRRK